MDISNRIVEANGITHQIAEAGTGPLVILCHGFPESWHSWRHQIRALAGGGYHAVGPDMRGYGRTGNPKDIDQYTLLDLVGDMIDIVNLLGYKEPPSSVTIGELRSRGTQPYCDQTSFER
jgi:pimeloyl-ACP methyl ester carboxylesterase